MMQNKEKVPLAHLPKIVQNERNVDSSSHYHGERVHGLSVPPSYGLSQAAH